MKDNRAAPIKPRKEVYRETCGSNQPMVEHQPMKDAMNPYPWYDITSGTCYSIIATVQIVPEDKPWSHQGQWSTAPSWCSDPKMAAKDEAGRKG